MFKALTKYYKVQLLASITLAIVLIALSLVKTPDKIIITLLGAILGTFTLDLDYFFYVYFLEPTKEFSINLKGYLKHKDIGGALTYMHTNQDDVDEKTLHSAFFQMLLVLITIMAVSSTSGLFVRVFIISTYANSLYRMTDYYFDGKMKEWFWALKKIPTKNSIIMYGTTMFAILVFILTLY